MIFFLIQFLIIFVDTFQVSILNKGACFKTDELKWILI